MDFSSLNNLGALNSITRYHVVKKVLTDFIDFRPRDPDTVGGSVGISRLYVWHEILCGLDRYRFDKKLFLLSFDVFS